MNQTLESSLRERWNFLEHQNDILTDYLNGIEKEIEDVMTSDVYRIIKKDFYRNKQEQSFIERLFDK